MSTPKFVNAADLAEAPSNNDVRKAIAACTDAAMLREALELEEAKDKPRSSRVKQLRFRLNVLDAMDAAEPIAEPEEVIEYDEPDPFAELEDMGGLQSFEPDDSAIINATDDEPTPTAEEHVELTPPGTIQEIADKLTEPASTIEAAPQAQRTPTENCAAVFVGAMADGDVALVREMFRQIRSGKYTDYDMAEALVKVFAVKAKPARRSTSIRSSTAGSAPKVPRLDAESADGMVFTYSCRKGAIVATGKVASDGRFTVLAGSQAATDQKGGKGNQAIKSDLLEDGVLVADGDALKFTKDWTAKTCSQAAAIVYGTNSNGRANWKAEDGRSIRDIEEALAASAEPEAASA